jgi:hyperosmotically inducible protein
MQTQKRLTVFVLMMTLIAPLLLAACGKSVGDTIDDATITTRVKTALLNDPDVGGLRIDVDTFKGVVTLSGRVRTKEDEAKAVALARKISGVTDVRSTLQVQPYPGSPLFDPDPFRLDPDLHQHSRHLIDHRRGAADETEGRRILD